MGVTRASINYAAEISNEKSLEPVTVIFCLHYLFLSEIFK